MHDDAAGYGRALFDAAFQDDGLRDAVSLLDEGRLLLVAKGRPAQIGWEYLRDPGGNLLAGRVDLVRALPEGDRRTLGVALDAQRRRDPGKARAGGSRRPGV
jgi:hypothetical protein